MNDYEPQWRVEFDPRYYGELGQAAYLITCNGVVICELPTELFMSRTRTTGPLDGDPIWNEPHEETERWAKFILTCIKRSFQDIADHVYDILPPEK